jgi:hypothetical protein
MGSPNKSIIGYAYRNPLDSPRKLDLIDHTRICSCTHLTNHSATRHCGHDSIGNLCLADTSGGKVGSMPFDDVLQARSGSTLLEEHDSPASICSDAYNALWGVPYTTPG